jgi:hypothetical protein
MPRDTARETRCITVLHNICIKIRQCLPTCNDVDSGLPTCGGPSRARGELSQDVRQTQNRTPTHQHLLVLQISLF